MKQLLLLLLLLAWREVQGKGIFAVSLNFTPAPTTLET